MSSHLITLLCHGPNHNHITQFCTVKQNHPCGWLSITPLGHAEVETQLYAQ